jgi:PERQ amino acid-rich with GYF domain-containing protein
VALIVIYPPRTVLIVDDEIYQMMLSLPPNESTTQEIISDTIYTHSSTLDGRHFAEEFLKRRKALGSALDATLPTMTAANSGSGSSSGSGWNEVLKKDKAKDASGEWNSAFKVVAGKRGRRRG